MNRLRIYMLIAAAIVVACWQMSKEVFFADTGKN
jgi:hypothetical protein